MNWTWPSTAPACLNFLFDFGNLTLVNVVVERESICCIGNKWRQVMKKSWTSCEHVRKILWTRYEQVESNKSFTSRYQGMNKSWASHEQVINKSRTSYDQIKNKLRLLCHEQAMSKLWTIHEQLNNNSKASHVQAMCKPLTGHE